MKTKQIAENTYLVNFEFTKEKNLFFELSKDKVDLIQPVDTKLNTNCEYKYVVFTKETVWDGLISSINAHEIIYTVINSNETSAEGSFKSSDQAIKFIKDLAEKNNLEITNEGSYWVEVNGDYSYYVEANYLY